MPIFFSLLMQLALLAVSRVDFSVGIKIPAKIAIMAITTSNSIKVKPFFLLKFLALPFGRPMVRLFSV